MRLTVCFGEVTLFAFTTYFLSSRITEAESCLNTCGKLCRQFETPSAKTMNASNPEANYSKILTPIKESLRRVEELLMECLDSRIPLVTKISNYVFLSGGKRVRPALLLLASGAAGKISEKACMAAAIIEYIHTATLLHDDVVDEGALRRSQKTPRMIWGNEASVLMGDYLVTKAFYYLAFFENHAIVKILSESINLMSQGEIIQLSLNHEKAKREDYLDIIYHKTATLIGASMSIGAILGEAEPKTVEALSRCGIAIGMAFQLVDDALDYDIDNAKLGKQPGKDLKEKKVTFPLKILMEQASGKDVETIRDILNKKDVSDRDVSKTIDLMNKYRSVEGALKKAEDYVADAKESLADMPKNPFARGIENLADYILVRKR